MRLSVAVLTLFSCVSLPAYADTAVPTNVLTVDLVQGRTPGVQAPCDGTSDARGIAPTKSGLMLPSPEQLFATVALTADPSVGMSTQDTPQPLHAGAVEHSDAFLLRGKIHRYASFATLPLFATEVALGQSLFNSDSNRGFHAGVGASITGLFVVNTVTGGWNLLGEEGRAEKEGRTLRLLHGLLMMAGDVGFIATSAVAPDGEHRNNGSFQSLQDARVRHRTFALTSMSVSTAGYLLMLFGNR